MYALTPHDKYGTLVIPICTRIDSCWSGGPDPVRACTSTQPDQQQYHTCSGYSPSPLADPPPPTPPSSNPYHLCLSSCTYRPTYLYMFDPACAPTPTSYPPPAPCTLPTQAQPMGPMDTLVHSSSHCMQQSTTCKAVPLLQVHQPVADMPLMHKHRQQAAAHPPVQLHLPHLPPQQDPCKPHVLTGGTVTFEVVCPRTCSRWLA